MLIKYMEPARTMEPPHPSGSMSPGIYYLRGIREAGQSSLLTTIPGYELLCEVDQYDALDQLLSTVAGKNIRIVEQNPDINEGGLFNPRLSGSELYKSSDWQILLTIIMKYLFTKEISLELQKEFRQIESRIRQKKRGEFSSEEKILISFMRALASWDKDVSVLIVHKCTVFSDISINILFLKCLAELSTRIAVFLNVSDVLKLKSL